MANRKFFDWVNALWNMYIYLVKMAFSRITPKILTFVYYAKNKTGHSNPFWVSYGPLKYVYKWWKVNFSGITPKILTFVYYAKKKIYPEVNCICMNQIWSKLIEKWPPKNQDGRHEFFFDISTIPAHHRDRLVYHVFHNT